MKTITKFMYGISFAIVLNFSLVNQVNATLPTITTGTLQVWLDATDVNADASVVTNGSAITLWKNKAAGGAGDFDIIDWFGQQADNPTYKSSNSNFMNKSSVQFKPTTGKALKNTTNFTSNLTLFMVACKPSNDWGKLLISYGINWCTGYMGGVMNTAWWNGNGVLWNRPDAKTNDQKAHIFIATADGTNFYNYITDLGGEVLDYQGTFTSPGAGPDGIIIGGGFNEMGGGEIAELIVYNGMLSQSDRQSVGNYLINKWFQSSQTYSPTIKDNGYSVVVNAFTKSITLNIGNSQATGFRVMDVSGKSVYCSNASFRGEKTFNLSLSKGVYFLKLNGNFSTKKFIVE